MKKNCKELFSYGLHDSVVTDLYLDKTSVCLTFNNGVYNLDTTGKETVLTSKCTLKLSLVDKREKMIQMYVEIFHISKQSFREIVFQDASTLVKKNSLIISNCYYSYFNSTILIDGFLAAKRLQILISNVHDVEFVFS